AHRIPDESSTQALKRLLGDPLEAAKLAHQAFRDVFSQHCLSDRLEQIVRDLNLRPGFEIKERPVRVAHLLATMRPALLGTCLRRLPADLYPQRELVVVLHGDNIDMAAARALVHPGEEVVLLHATRDRSLGDCLNMAIAHPDAPYWMKLDDDDHYGPAYTS